MSCCRRSLHRDFVAHGSGQGWRCRIGGFDQLSVMRGKGWPSFFFVRFSVGGSSPNPRKHKMRFNFGMADLDDSLGAIMFNVT